MINDNKVVSISNLETLISSSVLHHKKIVLAGGCFDLLHNGHREFLKAAKKRGDALFILLESDESISKSKGNNRPVHSQQQRISNLAQLNDVDFIIPLEGILSDKKYDELILAIKPAIIATTRPDSTRHHKERTGKLVNAEVIDVLDRLTQYSTTQLIGSQSE